MADDLTDSLLPALEIAAFLRRPDGSFASIAAVPSWFGGLVADATFPFLGHILEEADQFWNRGTVGFQEFGPCADVDAAGLEYHYKVIAVAARAGQFLLFQRDPAADRLRDVLQKARERALADEARGRRPAALAVLRNEAIDAADAIRELAARLSASPSRSEAAAALGHIERHCQRLRAAAAGSVQSPRS